MERICRQSRQERSTKEKHDEMAKLTARLEKAHERLAIKRAAGAERDALSRLERRIRDIQADIKSWGMAVAAIAMLSGCSKTGFDNCVEHQDINECAKYYHTPKERR